MVVKNKIKKSTMDQNIITMDMETRNYLVCSLRTKNPPIDPLVLADFNLKV